jgi:phosphoglycolate phosphatase-like HAD superfamily hydrolase
MIKLQKIELIIWDLDGTLLNSFDAHVDVATQVLRKHGLQVPTRGDMERHFHGKLRDSIAGLVGDVGEDKLDELLRDFLIVDNAYIENVDDHLFPDAVALCKKVHELGIRQVLVTNRAHGKDRGNASPRTIVKNSQLSEYIDVVLCGDEVTFHKPDPRVLNASDLVINPEHTLVIGDQFVDAQFAHNLGANSVIVRRDGSAVPHLDQLHSEAHSKMTSVVSLTI